MQAAAERALFLFLCGATRFSEEKNADMESKTVIWPQLAIHRESCKRHTHPEDTDIHRNWQDIIWYLEDKRPQNWKRLLISVKKVPKDTQQSFFEHYASFGS